MSTVSTVSTWPAISLFSSHSLPFLDMLRLVEEGGNPDGPDVGTGEVESMCGVGSSSTGFACGSRDAMVGSTVCAGGNRGAMGVSMVGWCSRTLGGFSFSCCLFTWKLVGSLKDEGVLLANFNSKKTNNY